MAYGMRPRDTVRTAKEAKEEDEEVEQVREEEEEEEVVYLPISAGWPTTYPSPTPVLSMHDRKMGECFFFKQAEIRGGDT